MTRIDYRRAIIELVAQLFPAEDHDRWMLTPHSALDGDWPALAMQQGNSGHSPQDSWRGETMMNYSPAMRKQTCYFTLLVVVPTATWLAVPIYGMVEACSIAALVLDIFGAALLASGLMSRHAAFYRIGRQMVRGGKGFVEWWVLRFPIALASRLGSMDANDTAGNMEEDYIDSFYGLVFLVLGFIGQAAAQVLR